MKFWDSLEHKGKYATIIGFILGLGSTIIMLTVLCKNGDFKYIPYVIGFGASILFFILPSSFKAKYKDFEIEIKD